MSSSEYYRSTRTGKALGQEVLHEEAGQHAGQLQSGPLRLGENTLVASAVACGQAAKSSQEVSNGTASRREDGGGHKRGEAVEGRHGKGRRKGGEERLRFVG